MINKVAFNNLVLTHKKPIQRIKTHTNQKLIQKIKKLNYALDKNPNHERNKERLGKAMMSLEDLKKMKCVDLIKKVLTLDKSPDAIRTNGLSTPEEIAIAMVALNKDMQDIVKGFQDKLGLTDENKTWKKELMQPSKRRLKILKTEMKCKYRQETKEQKIMARKRTEWLKTQNAGQNKDDTVDDNAQETDEGANVATLGYWNIEPIEDIQISKTKTKEKLKPDRVPKEKAVQVSENHDRKSNVKSLKTTTKKNASTEKLAHALTHKEKTAKFNNSLSSSIPSDFENDLYDKNCAVETHKKEITHVVDPFFITASGENYLSSAVVIRDGQVLEPQTNKVNIDSHKSDKGAYKKAAADKFNKHIKSSNYDNAGNKRRPNRKLPKTNEINNATDLHPSWAAKQRLKPVIGSFQGKKIKFDYDNFGEDGELNKAFNSKKDYRHNTQMTKKSQTKDNSLHPSWAAKQKLKACIKEFKGKKITFNNEGDGREKISTVASVNAPTTKRNLKNQNEADSGLHPSWVAKQNQKPVLTAFQGKKITFADDE
ncbi:uncharacterized protein Rlb1 [Eurosta solidaginis]|uniref:uncharacterized protein Rlb1 n=1 Tax=Eurosta solidaginis TaxID=178769 RepID=UPI003530C326